MSSKANKRSTQKAPTQVHAKSPWPKRLLWIGGSVLILGLIAIVFLNNPALRGVPDGTEQVAVAAPEHVDGDIHEDGDVPAGGPHAEVWQNCGYYDVEIESENAVHSLEHGAVWITYEPGLAEDQLRTLRGFAGGFDKVLVSPSGGSGFANHRDGMGEPARAHGCR